MAEKAKKKWKLQLPHVITLIFFLIVFVAILTWIVPSGAFQREVVSTAAGDREVAIAGTYAAVEKVTEDGDLRQGLAAVLQAPAKGIQASVEVLAFVFIIGGVFAIMDKTKAMTLGLRNVVKKLGNKGILIIPILMFLFGLGGSTFGMSDELVPFYLLLMPIILSMGYDSMTVFLIVCGGATIGYAASTVNPFSVLIAQGIAGIQGNPQLMFRMVQFVVMMAVVIGFTMLRARKIQKNPELSICYEDDLVKRQTLVTSEDEEAAEFDTRHKIVLAIFILGMILVVFGLVKYGWYMNELSMVFLGMGILMGIAGGLNEKEIASEFINGVAGIAFAAMVIGFCNGIMVVAQDGMIIDTILNALANMLKGTGNAVFVFFMYIVQSFLALLVPSSSGQAALTIPIMSSLCDLHGTNPEAAVTVLQYANQMTDIMSPVAGTTVAGLAVCGLTFGKWWKTFWKPWLVMTVIVLIFCTVSAGM